MNIQLIGKELLPAEMPILYAKPFTAESLKEDFDIRGGEWWVEDGWLTGKNPHNKPGMIISQADYFCDTVVDFKARTVLPSTHDIDVMWSGSWDYDKNVRDVAYVAGVEGWYFGKVGIEKCPDHTLNAATQIFPFEAGKIYHIQAGSAKGHVFVIIDGKLVLELTDPAPIDVTKHGKIGFEAYASHIQITDLVVRQAVFREMSVVYESEF